MTRTAIVGAHMGAVALAALGLAMWEAEGGAIWRDAIFSFCM